MSNITLDSLTYVGEGIQNGIGRFVERSVGIAKYFRTLTDSVVVNQKTERSVVKWKLVLPFPASQPDSCPCEGELPFVDTIVDITIRMDGRTSAAYRANIVDALQDLVQTSQFTDSVNNLATSS